MKRPDILARKNVTGANPALGFKRSTSFLGKLYVGHAVNMKSFRGSIMIEDHDHRIE